LAGYGPIPHLAGYGLFPVYWAGYGLFPVYWAGYGTCFSLEAKAVLTLALALL